MVTTYNGKASSACNRTIDYCAPGYTLNSLSFGYAGQWFYIEPLLLLSERIEERPGVVRAANGNLGEITSKRLHPA